MTDNNYKIKVWPKYEGISKAMNREILLQFGAIYNTTPEEILASIMFNDESYETHYIRIKGNNGMFLSKIDPNKESAVDEAIINPIINDGTIKDDKLEELIKIELNKIIIKTKINAFQN